MFCAELALFRKTFMASCDICWLSPCVNWEFMWIRVGPALYLWSPRLGDLNISYWYGPPQPSLIYIYLITAVIYRELGHWPFVGSVQSHWRENRLEKFLSLISMEKERRSIHPHYKARTPPFPLHRRISNRTVVLIEKGPVWATAGYRGIQILPGVRCTFGVWKELVSEKGKLLDLIVLVKAEELSPLWYPIPVPGPVFHCPFCR